MRKKPIANLTKDDLKAAASAHAATLARIWADATPLAKFVKDRAERLCREGTPGSRTDTRRVGNPSTKEQLVLYMQGQTDLMAAWGRAKTDTINDLIAGRLVGLGRPSDSYSFDRIDPSVWIGAEVDWAGTVSRDGTKIIEVRIVLPSALSAVQPNSQLEPEELTKVDAIRAAIIEYAKADPFLRQSLPSKRYRAYKSYISSKGFDPNKRGFSDKSFQKYELEFKRKIK